MKLTSLEHFRIDPLKLGGVASVVAGAAGGAMSWALGNALGGASAGVVAVTTVLVWYMVFSTPRRLLEAERVSQARESVLLSVAARACMEVTGSRSRTIMLLRARGRELSEALHEARRRTLLGLGVEESARRAAAGLASYSASSVLVSAVTLKPREATAAGEESQGLSASAQMGRETRVPVFMTLCFFAPTMLLLYSLFSHTYSAVSLAQLLAFEAVILDLGFYLCASERAAR